MSAIYKQQAARLAEHLSAVHKFRLKHASALEAVASLHGAKDWNTLCVQTPAQAAPLPSPEEARATLFPKRSFSDAALCDALLCQSVWAHDGPDEEQLALADHLVMRQIARGGGFIYIDVRANHRQAHLGWAMHQAGRSDFHVLNPRQASTEKLNPFAGLTDASQIAEVVLQVLPRSANNPGADFYRQTGHLALTAVAEAYLELDRKITFEGLAQLLAGPAENLAALERDLLAAHKDSKALSLMLDSYRVRSKDGVVLDEKRLREVLGGLAGRLAQNAQGHLRKFYHPAEQEGLSWKEMVSNGQGLYLHLPSEAFGQMGTILSASLRAALSELSVSDVRQPFTVFVIGDEESLWATEALRRAVGRLGIGFVVIGGQDLKLYNEVDAAVGAAGGFGRAAQVMLTEVRTQQALHVQLEEFKLWPVELLVPHQ